MKQKHKFPYNWTLADAEFTKDKGSVFSCFACGGGSTMGYKLAGYDVIGCNEIDPKMLKAYWRNHEPKFNYLEPIQTFKLRNDLPKELYNLDLLDGSPPCSVWSLAGLREKAWGKEKKFKEGQAEQVLDTLFFDFIDLAKKLQPKVVVAENVKGLMQGEAIKYLTEVHKQLDAAGYYSNHYLINAANAGVPQSRERVFVIGVRKDLAGPVVEQDGFFKKKLKLNLNFKQPLIPLKDFAEGKPKTKEQNYLPDRFGDHIVNLKDVCPTITTIDRYFIDKETVLTDDTLAKVGSFPLDYDYVGFKNQQYLIGMSVPPVLVANISDQIYKQILSKI